MEGALRCRPLATVDGDLDQAEARATESLSLAQGIGDADHIGRSIRALGIVAADRGDIERSEALQRDALEIFTDSGNDREMRESLGLSLSWRSCGAIGSRL